MKIEVSNGEIIDKITILLIKSEKIKDESKLKNVSNELCELLPLLSIININQEHPLFDKLYTVNLKLWEVEDSLRIMERDKSFNLEFIESARSVYYLNDDRAKIKKEINIITESTLVEEKSYVDY
jgi:hypothetical protein